MSFDGVRMTCAQRGNQNQGNSNKHAPRGTASLKRMRKVFARFQRRRRNDPLLAAAAAPQERRFNVCSCGQHKQQSAKYCIDCDDARKLLAKRFAQNKEMTPDAKTAITRQVYTLPLRRVPDVVGMRATSEDNLDRFLNIYERELSAQG